MAWAVPGLFRGLMRLQSVLFPTASYRACTGGEAAFALQALQQREEAVRNGKLATIVFVRDKNAKGQEVSGYIDYGHRQAPSQLSCPPAQYTDSM